MGEEETTDIIEPDDGSITANEDEPEAEEPEEQEKKTDDKDDKPETEALEALKKEIEESFNAKLSEKEKEIKRLGYALRHASKDEKKTSEEPGFTDAQLLAIMQEHKDDPTVMLQVMKEISKTHGKEIEKSAEKAADIKTKSSEMNQFLEKSYPDLLKEGTEQAEAIEKTVDWLHLQDHPFKKYLAISALQLRHLPQLVAKVKEDAKKEALAEIADGKRKSNIKNNIPAGSGKGDEGRAAVLSAEQLETAKKLFGNDKRLIARYAKMIGKKDGGAASTTVQ